MNDGAALPIAIGCGTILIDPQRCRGNNGGDRFVVARTLAQRGVEATVSPRRIEVTHP